MPIGFKGNPLGNYTAPHTSPPLYQSIYNTEGELVFERDVRTTTNGGYLFANTEVSSVIGETWNVATPYMRVANSMFRDDTTLKTVSSGADFSSVFNGGYMFFNCQNLENVCVQFPKLERCKAMFQECKNLKKLPDLDWQGTTMQYGYQMFRDSGLEGTIGKSGYYDGGNWHPYELFVINGFSGNDQATDLWADGDRNSPRMMFFGTKLEEVYISFPNVRCLTNMFGSCSKIKKAVISAPQVVGTHSDDGGGYAYSGCGRLFQSSNNLEICDIYANKCRGCDIIEFCNKVRYADVGTDYYATGFGANNSSYFVGFGEKFNPSYTSGDITYTKCILSLKFSKKVLGIMSALKKNNVWVVQQRTLHLGVGLQEGLKTRTTPSYVIDAGYYDYENGSESTDPHYVHNYYDLDGNPVIEHDVHEPYISTEQPKDADGNLLTTWSAVKNGVTYWAIGELREALDDALGKRWYNIKLYFN